ncbi:MAG: glycosyltransferase family 2 protein [Verrucomicrobiota bacterium]|nr:glycosyltransferase family 2 protein [Limisphaera sp.]MDW8381929.1 glycosyltransferase family 2 protein [Verrucomicrobiota bacterium]
MQTRLLTVIPVYNGERFLGQTLASLAIQTRLPDRVVVLDNGSTDGTEAIVRAFRACPCEFIRNPTNLGLFGNLNRALDFAAETEYLHLMPADDLLKPQFYEVMLRALESQPAPSLAWCLDERIDESGNHLSVSGRVTGRVRAWSVDAYLRKKAEIGNQALAGTLFKTGRGAAPCRFRMDMPILADVVFYAEWGQRSQSRIEVQQDLVQYRWHGGNMSCELMPGLQALVLDEWKAMQLVEGMRGGGNWIRTWKLRGLFGVRTGIKARRIRQLGQRAYAREIVAAGRRISGWPLWLAAQVLVHGREWIVYGLRRRRRQPWNVFS